jgi:chemotaxis protein histidine kinase CheA
MAIDTEIIKDFLDESKSLVEDLVTLLEDIEGDFSKVAKLADYGNGVDRVMGGAKSLALQVDSNHALHMIADLTAVCKAVGYKASQIEGNEQLFNACVGLLLDATETLQQLLDRIDQDTATLKKIIPQAFIERLTWASNQFSSDVRASVSSGNMNDLIKKLSH